MKSGLSKPQSRSVLCDSSYSFFFSHTSLELLLKYSLQVLNNWKHVGMLWAHQWGKTGKSACSHWFVIDLPMTPQILWTNLHGLQKYCCTAVVLYGYCGCVVLQEKVNSWECFMGTGFFPEMLKLLYLDRVSVLLWWIFHLQQQVEQSFWLLTHVWSLLLPQALGMVYKRWENEKVFASSSRRVWC